jgi:hypothetical protein
MMELLEIDELKNAAALRIEKLLPPNRPASAGSKQLRPLEKRHSIPARSLCPSRDRGWLTKCTDN